MSDTNGQDDWTIREPSVDDVARVVAEALADEDEYPEELIEIARHHPSALRPFHHDLVEACVWWSNLYLAADDEIVGLLVENLHAGNGRRSNILESLAATRSPMAVAALADVQASQPEWLAEELAHGGSVHAFAQHGGWEMGPDGEFRDLTTPVAFALVPATSEDEPQVAGVSLDERCTWCGSNLMKVLDVDLDDEQLVALGMNGCGRVTAVTCPWCVQYADALLGAYDGEGRAWMNEENVRPARLPLPRAGEELAPTALVLGPRRRTTTSADKWSHGGSTLGGQPDWVQNPSYPTCTRCGTTMSFLAMVNIEDIDDEPAEGNLYVSVHPRCHVTATTYQQS